MPRLIQAVPKYRKHKASGLAFVEINGRRHYLGPWQSKASKLEYDRRVYRMAFVWPVHVLRRS